MPTGARNFSTTSKNRCGPGQSKRSTPSLMRSGDIPAARRTDASGGLAESSSVSPKCAGTSPKSYRSRGWSSHGFWSSKGSLAVLRAAPQTAGSESPRRRSPATSTDVHIPVRSLPQRCGRSQNSRGGDGGCLPCGKGSLERSAGHRRSADSRTSRRHQGVHLG